MEAVCRCRASQGGPPQAVDDGCTGDEMSGGKMHPGPATSPPLRASQLSLAPPSTPDHRLTHQSNGMLIGWWWHVQVWEMMSSCFFLCQLYAVGLGIKNTFEDHLRRLLVQIVEVF